MDWEVLLRFPGATAVAVAAAVLVVVQWIKKLCELVAAWENGPSWARKFAEWWAHGWGPRYITLAISLLTVTLPPILEDGQLTMTELQVILTALEIGGLATVLYWVSRFKGPIGWLIKVFGKKKKPA